MDRLSLVDASQFSDDANADPITFPPNMADSDIILSRGDDGNRKFTAKTVAEIDSIYEVLKDSPLLGQELVASEPTTEDRQTTDELPAASTDPDGEAMVQEAAASQVPDELKSVRRTMRSLFKSLESKDYALAIRALDFSAVEEKDPELGPYALPKESVFKEITASHTAQEDTVTAIGDGKADKWSSGNKVVRWTSRGQPGKAQWVIGRFRETKSIRSVGVFWMDRWQGDVRLPKEWSLEVEQNGKWTLFNLYTTDKYDTRDKFRYRRGHSLRRIILWILMSKALLPLQKRQHLPDFIPSFFRKQSQSGGTRQQASRSESRETRSRYKGLHCIQISGADL